MSDPDGGVTDRTAHTERHVKQLHPVTADVGRYLRATATYTDAVGPGKSAEAVTAAAVAPDDDGRVTLSETMPTAGDTVTARIDDPDGGVTGITGGSGPSPPTAHQTG